MSFSEFIRTYLAEGLNQSFVPEEIGAFGYPIWCMLLLMCFGLFTQGIADPRTKRQKRFQFIVVSIFLLAIIWGLVQAFFYTLEVT